MGLPRLKKKKKKNTEGLSNPLSQDEYNRFKT